MIMFYSFNWLPIDTVMRRNRSKSAIRDCVENIRSCMTMSIGVDMTRKIVHDVTRQGVG